MILIAATALLASCGDFPPANQSANVPSNQNTSVAVVQKISPSPTPSPIIVFETSPTPEVTVNDAPRITLADGSSDLADTTGNLVAVNKLMIPVAGIKPEQLQDTFKASRSEGRVHDAIDIMAAEGTPVIAAADGEIARFFESVRGGITIYQFSRDKKLIYYYAHLLRRADNLQEGQFVRQGTVIGYVGDTGNSGTGNFHLHFAVWTVDDPKRFWDGTNINPYPLLRQ